MILLTNVKNGFFRAGFYRSNLQSNTQLEKKLSPYFGISLPKTNLQPNLLNEDYVFITLEDYSFDFFNLVDPIATFKEKEGLTLVITEERAKQENFEYNSGNNKHFLKINEIKKFLNYDTV